MVVTSKQQGRQRWNDRYTSKTQKKKKENEQNFLKKKKKRDLKPSEVSR